MRGEKCLLEQRSMFIDYEMLGRCIGHVTTGANAHRLMVGFLTRLQ